MYTKIHDLRIPSLLGAFREKEEAAGTDLFVEWQKEKGKKKTLPTQLSACCFLPGAKDEMSSLRQPQQTSLTAGEQPRVPEPEPRGNLSAALT